MLCARTFQDERILAQQLVGAQNLVAEVEQPLLVQDPAIGAERRAEFSMFDRKHVECICIGAEASLQVEIGSRGNCTARFGPRGQADAHGRGGARLPRRGMS